MELDLHKVLLNARNAATEDLLDRVTVYRTGMESAAVEVIEGELRRRGLSAADIAAHGERRADVLCAHDGTAYRCHFCFRPAVKHGWAWHRLFGRLPLFPRRFFWCQEHDPHRAE